MHLSVCSLQFLPRLQRQSPRVVFAKLPYFPSIPRRDLITIYAMAVITLMPQQVEIVRYLL